MKKIALILMLPILAISARSLTAQNVANYPSLGGEMIFSLASIDNDGNSEGNIMRWTPFFNIQGMYNIDFGNVFGLYTGLGIRNVGFIYEPPQEGEAPEQDLKKKYRTYNLGIPVGFKIGKLDKVFLYGGYEIEFPFHYKEKTFISGDKTDKITGWFSDRVEPFQNTLMAGIQLPYGLNFKFKYYLNNFLNKDFTELDENLQEFRPYDFDANLFYFSLSWGLFTNFSKQYEMHGHKELDLR
jgi:hypothetical protein